MVKPPSDEETTQTPATAEEITSTSATQTSTSLSDSVSPPVVDEAQIETIEVNTGVYQIAFSTLGAQPQTWEIIDPTYIRTHNGENGEEANNPHIIPDIPAAVGIRHMGYPLGVELPPPYDDDFNDAVWHVVEGPDVAANGDVHLAFESPEIGGLVLRKDFTFHEPERLESGQVDPSVNGGGYLCDFTLTLRNVGDGIVALNDSGQGMRLTWGAGISSFDRSGFYSIYNNRSPLAYVDDDTWYKTPKKSDNPHEIGSEDPDGVVWAGLLSRYFLAAVIPTGDHAPTIPRVIAEVKPQHDLSADEDWKGHTPLLTTSLVHEIILIEPGNESVNTYSLFVGPVARDILIASGHDLSRANFYNTWAWMRGLSIFLMRTLQVFNGIIHSYGWSILLLTIVIRLILYPITHRQMKIMARTQRDMARIKPHVDEVKAKYKDEPQKMQRAMMEVYKEHGVNPFAGLKGCLPLLLQMPIFFALWRMLSQSVELRGAPWLWVADLSNPDALFMLPFTIPFMGNAFNLLPILMAVTQWLTMKLSPTRIDDPTQRSMMTLMPIMLTVMLYNAPSGLMIYWVAGNIWQMGHQYLTTRWVQTHEPEGDTPEQPSAPAQGKDKAAKPQSPAKRRMEERRKEAAKARKRQMSESSSLPRWARRGGG